MSVLAKGDVRRWLIPAGITFCMAIIIVWQTLRLAIAPVAPAIAARMFGAASEGLTLRAVQLAEGGQADKTLPQARALALRAFRKSPVQAEALAVIAMADGQAGRPAGAREMVQAGRISRRSNLANLMLLQRSAASGDVLNMARDADIAMRAHPATWNSIIPALVTESDNPTFASALAVRMVGAPWRAALLRALNASPDHPDAAFRVWAALHRLRVGPTPDEAADYFQSATQRVAPPVLRRRWLLLDPTVDRVAANKAIYDGAFNGLGGSRPFNWAIRVGEGLDSRIEGHALQVRFDGDGTATAANQLLILPPGRHRLHWQDRTAEEQDSPQLGIAVTCVDGTLLASTTTAPSRSWQGRHSDFDVPSGCPGQWLSINVKRELGDPPIAFSVSDLSID